MKAPIFLLASLACLMPAAAQTSLDEAVAALGLLPSQRGGQHLSPDEFNPFSVKAKAVAASSEEVTDTQESRIRGILKKVKVAGIRRDTLGRMSALAGDLILREGEEVKPVLLEQTERLVVSRVAPTHVELTFIETKESTQPRTIIMPVRTQVAVSQKLFGQTEGGGELYVAKGLKPAEAVQAMAAMGAVPPAAGSMGRMAAVPSESAVAVAPGMTEPEKSSVAVTEMPSPRKPLNLQQDQHEVIPVGGAVLEKPHLEPVPAAPAVKPALTPPAPDSEAAAH